MKLVNQRQVEKVEAQWRGGCIPILPEIRCYSGEGEEVDKRTRGPRGHGGQGEQGKEVGPRGQGGQRGKERTSFIRPGRGKKKASMGLHLLSTSWSSPPRSLLVLGTLVMVIIHLV